MLNFILIIVFLVLPLLFTGLLAMWCYRNWQRNKNKTDRELINELDY